jgi:hypothetical protein
MHIQYITYRYSNLGGGEGGFGGWAFSIYVLFKKRKHKVSTVSVASLKRVPPFATASYFPCNIRHNPRGLA